MPDAERKTLEVDDEDLWLIIEGLLHRREKSGESDPAVIKRLTALLQRCDSLKRWGNTNATPRPLPEGSTISFDDGSRIVVVAVIGNLRVVVPPESAGIRAPGTDLEVLEVVRDRGNNKTWWWRGAPYTQHYEVGLDGTWKFTAK
mgnify:CR=1 FL=1